MSAFGSGAELTATRARIYDSAFRPHPFVDELNELFAYRDLVALWSVRNITLRYKRSVLGVLWTLLEPLLLMTTLAVVFTAIFRFALENYAIYILSGLIAYDFFSRSTCQVVDEVLSGQSIAQRIHLPRSAFAVATIASYLVNWSLALIPLFGIMLFLKHPFSWSLVAVPLCMLLMASFALGVGLIVSTLGASFHDIKLTYNVLLNIWFYATPIIYPIQIIPEDYRALMQLNPLFHLVSLFRSCIYDGQMAPASAWLITTLLSLVTVTFGWWLFTRSRSVFETGV